MQKKSNNRSILNDVTKGLNKIYIYSFILILNPTQIYLKFYLIYCYYISIRHLEKLQKKITKFQKAELFFVSDSVVHIYIHYFWNYLPLYIIIDIIALYIIMKHIKLKAKEKRKDIPMWMQGSKELHREIRKPFSVINAKK